MTNSEPKTPNYKELIKSANILLQKLIGFFIVGLYSPSKTKAQNISNIREIPGAELIQMFDREKTTEKIAELFREHFQLPISQEILVISQTGGSGVYGPVFVAKIVENGFDTKKRYLAFTFFPSILEGFKGIIFVDTSDFAVSGIKIDTVPSAWLKLGENYKVNINIQSTDQNSQKIEPRYDLVVEISEQSKTYNLTYKELVEIFGQNFTGANLYWFTELPR